MTTMLIIIAALNGLANADSRLVGTVQSTPDTPVTEPLSDAQAQRLLGQLLSAPCTKDRHLFE